jgi:outer membrane protein assembly factor BamD (BamD/ComL family)
VIRTAAPLLLALSAAATAAPLQCGGKPRPELRLEEEPAQALYGLAERFKAEGNQTARAETLRFIVERYPASRFAETAKVELAEMGVR